MRFSLLAIDAVINLVLGTLLLFRPTGIAAAPGVPEINNGFYPGILGAVISGTGIALLVECFRDSDKFVGLGPGGAITINLSGGIAPGVWLVAGNLSIPLRGFVFLWSLAALLVGISGAELVSGFRHQRQSTSTGRKGTDSE